MAAVKRALARIAAVFRRDALDRDFRDELNAHIDIVTDDNIRRGMTPEDARRAALISMGGVSSITEQHRQVRGLPWLDAARQDLSHALRMFRRSPWFFAGAMLTLALGIGANGAVFSILRTVLLQPLPYREPDRVVMVWRRQPNRPPAKADVLRPVVQRGALFGSAAKRLHSEAADVLESATYQSWQSNLEVQFDLSLPDRVVRLRGAAATANFFDVLGVGAALGRVFTVADEHANGHLLVLSDALWRRDFGADPGIIGRSVTMMAGRGPREATTFTVIGVLPPGVRFTYPEETEAWTIMPWSSAGYPTAGFWTVARLTRGVSLEAARARVAAIPVWLEKRPNARPEDLEVFSLEPITEWVVSEARPSLLLLAGVAGLLLLIACTTVASALFVRVTQRQEELALRAAIGAGRGRLVRQLLTEGVLLSVCGAALGTIVALLMSPIVRTIVPSSVPRAGDIGTGIDVSIIGFFALTAGAATLLAALAPAWRGTRFDVVSMLKQGAAGSSGDVSASRWRRALVGIQSAIATGLLLTAALLIVSFWKLNHVPLGFDAGNVLTVEMRPLTTKYAPVRPPAKPGEPRPPSSPSPALLTLQRELVARVSALPGVVDAAIATAVPFRGIDITYRLDRMGTQKWLAGNGRIVSPRYFSVLQVPLIRGRLFTEQDTLGSPKVTVISESWARQMFGAEEPIGQFIDFDGPTEVVGIVADLRYKSFDTDPVPAIYFSSLQEPSELMCIVARLAPNAGNLDAAVTAIVKELDPDLPAMKLTTVRQILSESVSDRRFYTAATTALASLALVLTIVGLVVVVSRAVVERRREMAIRVALGATTRDLVQSVMLQGMTPVVVGIAVGLFGVAAGAVLLQQFLFQTAPRSPLLYAAVAAVVLASAAAASLIPARRVATVSPVATLRAE